MPPARYAIAQNNMFESTAITSIRSIKLMCQNLKNYVIASSLFHHQFDKLKKERRAFLTI
jgi:hypothetical protein